MSELSDEELIQECRHGQPAAFGRLVLKYQKPLFNSALRLLGDYEEARDVTQTALVKAYEKLAMYNPHYKFFSWVFRILVNEALNVRQRLKGMAPLEDTMVAPDPSPEQLLQRARLDGALDRALFQLSAEQRALVVLRHYQDLSYQELAYVFDTAEKTIKSRLFSARRRLLELLQLQGVMSHDG